MLARLSVLGLYNYDPTIFDGLTMPGDLDKDAFIALIMQECSELATVYPNPVVFKTVFNAWAKRHAPIWAKLYNTTQFQYNPIDNYDRHEEYTDTHTGTSTLTGTGSSTGTSEATSTGSATSFDSGALATTEQTVTDGSSQSSSESSSQGADQYTNIHSAHLRGNIGTVTTQAMIREEREVVTFDLYQEMLTDFMDTFCVCVY